MAATAPRRTAPARIAAWAPLLLLVALAAGLRLATLGDKGYWGDEISTVLLTRDRMQVMFHQVARLESTPPLYYMLAWVWAKAFGTSEAGLRSLSALMGIALVPVAHLAGRELISRRAGLVAALFVACNPFLVWYSQEARSYALLALLGGCALLAFARARRNPTRGALAAWAAACSLALATHYFAVFLAGPQAVALLRRSPRSRRVLAAVLVVAAAGAGLLPLALRQRSFGHAAWIAQTPLALRLASTPFVFLLGFDLSSPWLFGALVAPVGLTGLWLALRRMGPRRGSGVAVAGSLFAAGIVAPVALGIVGLDYLSPRNLIVLALPLLIVLAAGFTESPRRRLACAAGSGLVAISLVLVLTGAHEPKYHSEAWRAAAAALGPASVPRAILALPGQAGRKPLEYYLPETSRLPLAGALVRELDVLSLPPQGSSLPHPPPLPGPLRKLGHYVAVQRLGDDFRVLRLRFAHAVRLTPAALSVPAAPRKLLRVALIQR